MAPPRTRCIRRWLILVGLLVAPVLGSPGLGVLGRGAATAVADEVGTSAARRLLAAPEPSARAAAVRRLAGATDEASIRLVASVLSDPHPYVRRAAAGVLGIVVDPGVRKRLLREGPGWHDPVARRALTHAFSAWADGDGRQGLLGALRDRDPGVRAEAAGYLADDPEPRAGEALRDAATDADPVVRATALGGLAARQGLRGAVPVPVAWGAALRDADARVRMAALEGSVGAGGEAAVFAVAHGLDDAVWSVRLVAAELAGTVRDHRVLEPLVGALRDPRERVVQSAGTSLVRLTGIPFDPTPERWRAWLEAEGRSFEPADVGEPQRGGPPPGERTVASARFLDVPVPSSHVAFVLDASGSMSACGADGVSRWDRVRAEVDAVLDRLGAAAEGNVILFADEAAPVFPRAVRFSPAARETVRATLAARRPGGRTALYDGIASALGDPAVDAVIVLSDGAPSAGSWFTKTDVRRELLRANRWHRARIDVISVGTDEVAKRWRPLLREIAEDHGGRFTAR